MNPEHILALIGAVAIVLLVAGVVGLIKWYKRWYL